MNMADAAGPRYPLVVFDFDGTLADTLASSLATFNELAGRFGFRPITDPEDARRLTTIEFLRRQRVPVWRLPGLIRAFLVAQRGRMDSTRLFPGIPEVLVRLRGRGVRLGILSSNTADNITVCLRANGVNGLFDFVNGGSRLFGKGRALRRVLRAGQVRPTDALYVGDEARDVDAARWAGADAAAVAWGFHSPAVLVGRRPTHLLDQPGQLFDLVYPRG
jgi:phosphoglycolate phosphatase